MWHPTGRGESTLQRPPVLVIVEDTALAQAIANDIDARGYRTFVATSVGDALRLIARRSYSLIVADYFGPIRQLWYRWPILQLLARFAPHTPVLALSMLREVPESSNLAAVVPLPDYADQLAEGLKRHTLAVPERTRDPFLARYLAALWDGNADEGAGVVSEAMKAGWSGAAIHEELFSTALNEIGNWWQAESCTVADEHGARLITERLMANVSATVERRPPNGRCVIVACVEGERHELGARITADLFDWDGWTVRLLGADTPADELISETRRRKADVVGLSATMEPSWQAIRSQISKLRAAGARIIIVGGQAFRTLDIDSFVALGATARANRATSGVELVTQFVKRGI